MPRYIDADALMDELKKLREFWGFTFTADGVDEAIDKVEEAPDADAVPKSEVENLKVLLEMTEKAHEGLRELYRTDTDALVEARIKTETEVAREIFEEIETSLSIGNFKGSEVVYVIRAEDYLHYKKKYTEEK